MNAGLRTHKSASLRVSIPDVPDVENNLREILGVKSESKRSGEATALLHQVTTEADFAFMVLFLQVLPFDDGMTEEQLVKFYEKLGFLVVQTEPVLIMSRLPSRPKLAKVH